MSTARDILFLLAPGFSENGETWFCPYCAQVVGMLTYFPEVRSTLDIREVGFEKPRLPIVELIGEAMQSCPVLVLAEASRVPTELDDKVIVSQSRRVISNTNAILHYLANTRSLPKPH